MYRGLTVQPQQHNLALGGLKHNHKSTHGTIMKKMHIKCNNMFYIHFIYIHIHIIRRKMEL